MEIRNDVKELVMMDIEELVPFQGNLKNLTKRNYEKLKKQIYSLGFSAPFFAWRDPSDKKLYLLDGHQRHRALKQMRVEESFSMPKLPVVIIAAEDKTQAKKKVLSLTSQYGNMTDEGLYEFMSESGLSIPDIEDFRFPEIGIDSFKKSFFEEPEETIVQPAGVHLCPNCGFNLDQKDAE
jgi:hypothetical protein